MTRQGEVDANKWIIHKRKIQKNWAHVVTGRKRLPLCFWSTRPLRRLWKSLLASPLLEAGREVKRIPSRQQHSVPKRGQCWKRGSHTRCPQGPGRDHRWDSRSEEDGGPWKSPPKCSHCHVHRKLCLTRPLKRVSADTHFCSLWGQTAVGWTPGLPLISVWPWDYALTTWRFSILLCKIGLYLVSLNDCHENGHKVP